MFKSLIVLAATALAATLAIVPAANAGCGHHHGGGYSRSYSSVPSARFSQAAAKRRAAARAQAQRQQLASARAAKAEKARVAKAEAKVEKQDVAATTEIQDDAAPKSAEPVETGSIDSPADKASGKVDVAAAKTCSRFVAAVGKTIAVECDNDKN